MRNIRVIIAFLGIYLFVFALALVAAFGLWLSRYFPDSSVQPLFLLEVSALSSNTAHITGKRYPAGVTALSSAVTRVNDGSSDTEVLFETQSSVIFVSVMRVSFSEKLVPLGYFSMARITEITDATGKILYQSSDSFLDSLFGKFLLKSQTTTEKKSIVLIAKEKATSYTVVNTPSGITQYEN